MIRTGILIFLFLFLWVFVLLSIADRGVQNFLLLTAPPLSVWLVSRSAYLLRKKIRAFSGR